MFNSIQPCLPTAGIRRYPSITFNETNFFAVDLQSSSVYYFSCRMLARSQYPEGPTTVHLGTDFSWFPCVYKRMLRWFPRLQVATACFSCSPPDL